MFLCTHIEILAKWATLYNHIYMIVPWTVYAQGLYKLSIFKLHERIITTMLFMYMYTYVKDHLKTASPFWLGSLGATEEDAKI